LTLSIEERSDTAEASSSAVNSGARRTTSSSGVTKGTLLA
jgi:hypothetical protein